MTLANLLPSLTKSWADEVNEELDEQLLDDIVRTRYPVNTSGQDHSSEVEEAAIELPDFTDREALEFSDEEYTFNCRPSTSRAEMVSNDERAAVVTHPNQTLSPNSNTVAKYMSMDIPRTLPYSIPGSNASNSFNENPDNKKHKGVSDTGLEERATAATPYSFETWDEPTEDLLAHLNGFTSGIEPVQTTPELDSSFFSDQDSHYSSHSEEDKEELRIDHPLMGKNVVGIHVSFELVKACEYDANPPKVFYRGWKPQRWGWAPSNLRFCQTVVRNEGPIYKK